MLDARGAGGALAGVAHVGATSGFIALLLPPLAGLHRRGLRVDLRAMPPPALLSALAERVIDVAVTPARIPHKGVEYQLLHECPQRLVCAPQWSGRLPKSAAPRGLPLIDQQGPAAPLTPYWKQVYARDPEAPALVLPDYQTALDAAAPAPDWQWRPNACAATPCGPGSWSPRRRPGVRRLSPCTPRAPRTAVRARALLPGTIDRGGRALVARPRRSAQLRHVVLLHRPAAPAQLVLMRRRSASAAPARHAR